MNRDYWNDRPPLTPLQSLQQEERSCRQRLHSLTQEINRLKRVRARTQSQLQATNVRIKELKEKS